MIVMKFGGTSVGSAEAILNTVKIIKSNIEKNPFIVVSALSGVTDLLISAAKHAKKGHEDNKYYHKIVNKHHETLKGLSLDTEVLFSELNKLDIALKGICYLRELTPRTMDFIMSFGEVCSSKIISLYLKQIRIKSKAYNGWDVGIITNSKYNSASYLKDTFSRIKKKMSGLNHVPVITGFVAKDKNNEITTLGRGGSDTTAALVGSGIGADEIQIWTDVDGVMTCDPRICKDAQKLDTISFKEASELAYFGAKILHPHTIAPAMERNIPVIVKNTFNPESSGTTVLLNKEKKNDITGIAIKKNVTEITIESGRMLDAHGFMHRIFKVFDDFQVSVDLVATSEVSVSITLDKSIKGINEVVQELEKIGTVQCRSDQAIICIVGDGIKDNPKLKGEIITTIAEEDVKIRMISQGASSINISLVVNTNQAEKAVIALHKHFISAKGL